MSKAAVQRAALRRLAEGAAPELELLAEATGRSAAALAKLAGDEGWRLGFATDSVAPRLRRMLDNLIARLELLIGGLEKGEGEVEKTVTGEITTLLRGVEKLQAMLPGTDNNKKNDKDALVHDAEARDRDLARLHTRIDDRVTELAEEAAKRLVARELERRAGHATGG